MAGKRRTKKTGRIKAQKELERILSTIQGEPDYTFDHQRREELRLTPRVLSLAGNRELFSQLACRDYFYLRNLPILASERILPLLLPQSVWGRAQNGHGMFCDERGRPLMFPEATIDHVVTSLGTENLGIQSALVKLERQKILQNLEGFIHRCLETERVTFGSPESEEENPLGLRFLEGVTVESPLLLKGFVLGGMIDNYHYRQLTARHFRVTLRGAPLFLGGGETYLVNRQRLTQVGLTELAASNNVFPKEDIRRLRDLGIIVSESKNEDHPKPVGMYFRREAGPGVSDDASIIFVGKTYGPDAMYGFLLADAADTYDKYLDSYMEHGHDEKMARMIFGQPCFAEQPCVTREEIRRAIYFSAKANDPSIEVSSSHRRLIQIEPGARVPTFLNHMAYVNGQKPARIHMGYNRVDSEKFYRAVSDRASTLRLDW